MWDQDQDVIQWRTLSHTYPVARKKHKCALCSKPITVGTKHEKIVGIDDEGSLQYWRQHSSQCFMYEEDNDGLPLT